MGATVLRIDTVALLFDSDGVLVDSNDEGERAWSRWAGEHGLTAAEVLDGVRGRRSKETVALFLPEAARPDGLALIEGFEISTADATRPIAGAAELLRALPATGWAVVTSASPALLRARFAGAGLRRPPVLVTGDDVADGKPAPDGYLQAAAELHVPIGDCVVFEDSAAGVSAGRAAGAAHVIGVGEGALATDADPVVRDLRGIRWDGRTLDVPAGSRLR